MLRGVVKCQFFLRHFCCHRQFLFVDLNLLVMRKYFPFMLQLFYSPLRDVAAAQNIVNDIEKQSFFLMTIIKMVIVKFITPSGLDHTSVTESLKKSFYFAVSDWEVIASCHCNGQALECDSEVSLVKSYESNETNIPYPVQCNYMCTIAVFVFHN